MYSKYVRYTAVHKSSTVTVSLTNEMESEQLDQLVGACIQPIIFFSTW